MNQPEVTMRWLSYLMLLEWDSYLFLFLCKVSKNMFYKQNNTSWGSLQQKSQAPEEEPHRPQPGEAPKEQLAMVFTFGAY